MPVTPARTVRLTDDEWAAIEELGRTWGPVKPLSPPDVIRELLRLHKKSETKRKDPRKRDATESE